MPEFWEATFSENQMMWGPEATASAIFARDYFKQTGAKDVLIPGVGYGRNAKPFLDAGMSVVGIEISESAISLARSQLGLDFPIHHGPVAKMPFDANLYDGVFAYAIIQLLDAVGRKKFIEDCYRQLRPGGHMIITAVSKMAPMYGTGSKLAEDWYELMPNLRMYFYDADSIQREFGAHGLVDFIPIEEHLENGGVLPFFNVICKKPSKRHS